MKILMAACMLSSLAAFSSPAVTPAYAATSAQDCTGDDCEPKRSATERNCRRNTPVS